MNLNSLNIKRIAGVMLIAGGLIIVGIIVPVRIWLLILGALLIWYGYITVKSI